MKSIKCLAFLAVCMICGCSASNEDITESFKLPKELQGYKVICMRSDGGTPLYVIVKKGEEDREVIGTTQPAGKYQVHTIVVDDVEYVRKGN